MDKILPTYPMSKFRQAQGEVLKTIKISPVLLTHHGEAEAVIVSVQNYNLLIALVRQSNNQQLLASRIKEMENDPDSFIVLNEKNKALWLEGWLDGS